MTIEQRPPYPESKDCSCGEPEWEWQFENVWSCLGCGDMLVQANNDKVQKEKAETPSAGDKVSIKVIGAGETTYEQGTILKVDNEGVWLDNGPGNEPSGPFDAKTGYDLRDLPFLALSTNLVYDGGKAVRDYENQRKEE